jgi:iron(III) transport system ATP-binding protein
MSQVKFVGIKKQYPAINGQESVFAVEDFNLVINDGEFVSFLGPSGCGKTTTLRMIAGLEKNTHGKIFLGEDLVSDPENKFFLPPEKRHVGMVFQSYAVWPHMNVFDNVAYPLKIQKFSKNEIEKKVLKILEVVEMTGLEKRMPNQLSGGQQQRVALARGLVMEPKVLLLDEPLSNLDAKLREKMRKDIRDIQKKLKLTVVYVTHDQVEANTMSDRVVIMKSGKILQVGTPAEIKAKPANDFVREFIQ